MSSKKIFVLFSRKENFIPQAFKTKATVYKYLKINANLDYQTFTSTIQAEKFIQKRIKLNKNPFINTLQKIQKQTAPVSINIQTSSHLNKTKILDSKQEERQFKVKQFNEIKDNVQKRMQDHKISPISYVIEKNVEVVTQEIDNFKTAQKIQDQIIQIELKVQMKQQVKQAQTIKEQAKQQLALIVQMKQQKKQAQTIKEQVKQQLALIVQIKQQVKQAYTIREIGIQNKQFLNKGKVSQKLKQIIPRYEVSPIENIQKRPYQFQLFTSIKRIQNPGYTIASYVLKEQNNIIKSRKISLGVKKASQGQIYGLACALADLQASQIGQNPIIARIWCKKEDFTHYQNSIDKKIKQAASLLKNASINIKKIDYVF